MNTAAWADMVALNLPFASLTNSIATGVNNSGQIVGIWRDTSGTTHGFLDSGGTFSSIDIPSGLIGQALGINDAGLISGVFTSAGASFAFVEDAADLGNFSYPDAPAGVVSAYINDSGQIAGSYSIGNNEQGYLLDNGVLTSPIEYPDAPSTVIEGINNSGEMTGSGSGIPLYNTQVFVRSGAGIFTTIFPGAQNFYGMGINNTGELVGSYQINFSINGFLYNNGAFSTIDFNGASQTELFGINDNGVVVGGYASSTSNGIQAFEDIIAPEPSSFLLLGTAGLGLAWRRSAKRVRFRKW